MPSPRVSPVTRPKSVSTPTLPVGIEVTLHNNRSKTIATATMRRNPPLRKLGMPGSGPEYPLRELSDIFPPAHNAHLSPLPTDGDCIAMIVGTLLFLSSPTSCAMKSPQNREAP